MVICAESLYRAGTEAPPGNVEECTERSSANSNSQRWTCCVLFDLLTALFLKLILEEERFLESVRRFSVEQSQSDPKLRIFPCAATVPSERPISGRHEGSMLM